MTLLSDGDLALMHDTLIGLSNATLTEICGSGAPDRNGDPGVGAVLWSGSAPGFLNRDTKSVLSGGIAVDQQVTTFEIFDEAGATVLYAAGGDWAASTVVIVDHRLTPSRTRRWAVTGLVHDQDNTLDNVMLELDTETAA